ncbi:MAG: LysR family transcriptional regulator [Lachnospiraceae bacterium]|nr:LysR family transcriptional regulator [Lachnospiraceae bacterium]
MNQQKISCFLAVAETLSFSKAARKLYMSQSTVTYQIQSLEHELQIDLFCRNTTSVSLTGAGQIFLKDAKKLNEMYLRIEQNMKQIRDRRPFTFAVMPSMILFEGDRLRSLIRELEQLSEHPVETIVVQDTQKSMMEILEGRIDFLFIGREFCEPWARQLKIVPLYNSRLFVMLSSSHPLAVLEEIGSKDLEGETVFLSDEDPCFFPVIKNTLLCRGISVSYRTLQSYQILLPFVEMNQGISFTVSRFPVPESVCFRPVSLGVNIQISLCAAASNPAPEIAMFADAVQRFVQKHPSEDWKLEC